MPGAPPKKPGLDPKAIGVLAAAAVVLIAVVATAVLLTMRADPGEPSETAGTQVRDGNFAFVVAGVERVDVVADPQFPELRKAATGEYLIVSMTVTNIGTEPQTFFASFITLSDGATVYESDDEAWIYLGNTLADLNPGDSVDTAVVFDVPRGTDPESIELREGPSSDGVTVGLSQSE